MRKIILLTITLIIIALLGCIIGFGMKIGKLEIPSYMDIDEKSETLDNLIAKFEVKNSKELSGVQGNIDSAIKTYEQQKQAYEEKLAEKQTDLLNYDSANCYEIDFLWTRIGNYATDHGLDLELNVSKSASDQNEQDYVLADLSFLATGDYIEIANFINKIEKDERLGFEIRDFNMKMETETKIENKKEVKKSYLKAGFNVYSVAINKATLTELNNLQSENSLTDNGLTNSGLMDSLNLNKSTTNTTNTTNTLKKSTKNTVSSNTNS